MIFQLTKKDQALVSEDKTMITKNDGLFNEYQSLMIQADNPWDAKEMANEFDDAINWHDENQADCRAHLPIDPPGVLMATLITVRN